MNHQIGLLRKFSAVGHHCVYLYDAKSGKIIKEEYVPSEGRLFICLGFADVKPDDDESIDSGPYKLMLILCYDGIKWIQMRTAGSNSFYD